MPSLRRRSGTQLSASSPCSSRSVAVRVVPASQHEQVVVSLPSSQSSPNSAARVGVGVGSGVATETSCLAIFKFQVYVLDNPEDDDPLHMATRKLHDILRAPQYIPCLSADFPDLSDETYDRLSSYYKSLDVFKEALLKVRATALSILPHPSRHCLHLACTLHHPFPSTLIISPSTIFYPWLTSNPHLAKPNF